MKQSFNQFAVGFLTTILGGLFLLLLHGVIVGGPLAVFVPRCSSAWELSKLAFWPLLLACLLRRGKGGMPLSALVLTPLALMLADWAVLALGGNGGICLALWVAALALALAFGRPCSEKWHWIWMAAAVALGLSYLLLTYFAPPWGPFLCPGDVAAMAPIPF
ncbi:MAG: hypothetical protein RRY97_07490 [Oscillibacter sp.]